MRTSPRFHALTIADVRAETADAISVAFTVPETFAAAYRYDAGQYLTLRATIDGASVRRSYSICTAPEDGELRVCIKHVPGGLFSGWAHERLRVGDVLDVMTPGGRFTLPPAFGRGQNGGPGQKRERGRIVVAFAAGSGITPVMA